MIRKLLLRNATFARTLPLDRTQGFLHYGYLRTYVARHEIELVLDVGANIGQFATELREIGYKGRILSFEPVKAQFNTLSSKSDGDLRWEIFNFALGQTDEVAEINVMKAGVLSSFKTPSSSDTALFQTDNEIISKEEVSVRRLDEVIDEMGLVGELSRTLLKTDTQGFDLEVLKGAGQYLSKIKLVQSELSVMKIYQDLPPMDVVLRFFDEAGFSPIGLFPVTRMPDGSIIEFDYFGINRRPL